MVKKRIKRIAPRRVTLTSPEFKKEVLKIIKEAEVILIAAGERFITLPDGWIKDLKTKRDHGPSSTERMTKEEAIKWCQKMGGYLPERWESEPLQDLKRHNPCCDPIFKDMKSEWYWTNTPVPGLLGASFVVSFDDGDVGNGNEYSRFYVRPVRASQC